MGKSIGGTNKFPFGPTGIQVCAANNGAAVIGSKYISKQCSSAQYKIFTDIAGVPAIDTITVTGTATEAGNITILVGTVSFTVAIADTSTAAVIAASIKDAAITANLVATSASGVATITHAEAGVAVVSTITGTVAGVTADAANKTPGKDAVRGIAPITVATQIGKDRTLLALQSNGIDVTSDDAAVSAALITGECAVRVYNSNGVTVGFVFEFGNNIVSVNTASAGNVTDNTFITGTYTLASVDAAGAPVLPADVARYDFVVPSYTAGNVNLI